MFGPTYQDLENVQKQQAINASALAELCVQKGLFTVEEWKATHMRATAAMDQHWEEIKRERMADFMADNPNMGALAKVFFGVSDGNSPSQS